MRLTEGMDEGPVCLCEETPIGPDETAGELSERLAEIGAGLVVRTLEGLGAGTLVPEGAGSRQGFIRAASREERWRAGLERGRDSHLPADPRHEPLARRLDGVRGRRLGRETWQIVRAVEAEEKGNRGSSRPRGGRESS